MKSIDILFSNDVKRIGEQLLERLGEIYAKINSILGYELLKVKGLGEYSLYPYFFRNDFPTVNDDDFLKISIAGALYFDLVMINDDLYDGTSVVSESEIIFAKDFLCLESTKILSKLFDDKSIFWDYFYKYNGEFVIANKLEKRKAETDNYTYEEFQRIARGKSAIAKITVAALGCLAEDYHKIDELEETQGLVAEAAQLFDDLRDWKEDIKIGQASWILNKIRKDYDLDKTEGLETIRRLLFSNGYCETVITKIKRLCTKALLCGGKTEAWHIRIRLLQERAIRLCEDVIEIKGESSVNFVVCDECYGTGDVCIKTIFEFLKKQRENNFLEMQHRMCFMHVEGFTAENEYVSGEIFQKAYLYNLLYEVQRREKKFFIHKISDVKEILSSHAKFYDYGWSYFPDLPELAPDIDTLAEVIKLSKNYGFDKEVEERINKTLDMVFAMQKTDESGFITWILPNEQNEIVEKARYMAECFWGMEYDIEVNLNFIFALCVWDKDKYDIIIRNQIKIIEDKVVAGISLESTWYCSKFYSYYLFARICEQGNYVSAATIENVLNYIATQQNENGSWGEKDTCATDTAYAIYAISIFDYMDKKNRDLVYKGVDFLKRSYEEDGFWFSEKFIKMAVGPVNRRNKIFTYESSVITTINALLGYLVGQTYLGE